MAGEEPGAGGRGSLETEDSIFIEKVLLSSLEREFSASSSLKVVVSVLLEVFCESAEALLALEEESEPIIGEMPEFAVLSPFEFPVLSDLFFLNDLKSEGDPGGMAADDANCFLSVPGTALSNSDCDQECILASFPLPGAVLLTAEVPEEDAANGLVSVGRDEDAAEGDEGPEEVEEAFAPLTCTLEAPPGECCATFTTAVSVCLSVMLFRRLLACVGDPCPFLGVLLALAPLLLVVFDCTGLVEALRDELDALVGGEEAEFPLFTFVVPKSSSGTTPAAANDEEDALYDALELVGDPLEP